jgi:hypothetical protein
MGVFKHGGYTLNLYVLSFFFLWEQDDTQAMEFGLNYRAFERPLRFAQSWISNASMMVSGGFFIFHDFSRVFPIFFQYFSMV